MFNLATLKLRAILAACMALGVALAVGTIIVQHKRINALQESTGALKLLLEQEQAVNKTIQGQRDKDQASILTMGREIAQITEERDKYEMLLDKASRKGNLLDSKPGLMQRRIDDGSRRMFESISEATKGSVTGVDSSSEASPGSGT